MYRHGLGSTLALCALLAVVAPAGAVTVDIDIRTEGEPVPGTTITFETTDGEEIPPSQLSELGEDQDPAAAPRDEPPATGLEEEEPQDETPAATTDEDTAQDQPPEPTAESGTPPMTDQPDSTDEPYAPVRVELPDSLVGEDFIIVVRKGDEVIKREPARLDPEKTGFAIEAYDPADASLALEMSQPEVCRRERDCAHSLAITNTGNGIYKGPVFLSGTLHGTPRTSGDKSSDWWCGYAGGGKQLCHADVSLQPGETAKWDLTVRLGNRISQRASRCVGLFKVAEETAGKRDPLLQGVQLGLARRGIATGRPDGIMGPRTRTAVSKFLEQEGLPSAMPMDQVFQALHGLPAARIARLGGTGEKSCARLSLVKEKPRVSKKKRKKRRVRREAVEEDLYEEADEPRVRIQIGIGFGGTVGGRRHHRGRTHRERRSRETRTERRRERRIEREWQD